MEVNILTGVRFEVSAESSMLLLVMSMAAVGSFVHAGTSFVSYVGNRRMRYSWLPWYAFRTVIGSSLATVSYVVVRAGLLSGSSGASEVNIFGVAALAGLTGMFSKQATDKLKEIFDSIFTSRGDDHRLDKLEDLRILSVTPESVRRDSGAFEARLFGRGFHPTVSAEVNGSERAVNYVDQREVRINVQASDLEGMSTLRFLVVAPSGETSNQAVVQVKPA